MELLLAKGEPFVLIILDSVENPDHEDQKTLILWVKSNKKELSRICRGLVSIEPDKALRLLKRAQAAAMALAFGLCMKITPDLATAEALAGRLLSGEVLPETDGE
jgi:hypothetical protein